MLYTFLIAIGLSSDVIDFDVMLRSRETKVNTYVTGRERARLLYVLSPSPFALIRFFFNICPIPAILLFDRSAASRRVE